MKNLIVFTAFLSTLLGMASSANAEDSILMTEQDVDWATMVCPFTVIGGPKSIGTLTVSCFSDTSCAVYTGNNYSWGGHGGNPTLTNGTKRLSNDAMANVGLTTACNNAGTQSILLQVQNPPGNITVQRCMQATVVSGAFACTTSGNLDVSSF